MTKLSVNLNKVALVRNSRGRDEPSVREAAETCLAAGADGITLHPRPDQRHARPADVVAMKELLADRDGLELNVEGNPFPEFMDLVLTTQPEQCTLVPDEPGALTSDHGWLLSRDANRIVPLIDQLKSAGIRVSLFMDPDLDEISIAQQVGADRIELYTEPYAATFGTPAQDEVFQQFDAAARHAQTLGIGVNAGHDLNLLNLGLLLTIPNVLEVSIGHALIADALRIGLSAAVGEYVALING